jgi:hypothetical protein
MAYSSPIATLSAGLSSQPGTFALFEQFLNSYAMEHRLIRIRTPEHYGKVERFDATIKRQLLRLAVPAGHWKA